MRILVVEDDPTIGEQMATGLTREGFDIDLVTTASAALDAAPADLVLLDLGLPDVDGREVCRRLRERSGIPIIVVTARGDELDRVLLLEMGADDYVVKPYGFRELVARIRAVSRRAGGTDAPADIQDIDGLRLDRRAHRVHVDGVEVDLTPKEHELLAMLAEDPGAVCTRQEIIDRVWDPHWYGPTKTLDVHVASLRKKLGSPAWIETVRGVGYRLGRAATPNDPS